MPDTKIINHLPQNAIVIKNDDSIEDIEKLIASKRPVVLEFPAFTDGRAFSQARAIRRHGFKGDLIASGDLRSDQARHYAQVGFNLLHFAGDYNQTVIELAITRFSTPYQTSSQANDVVYQKRLRKEQLATLSGGGAFDKQ